MTANGAREGIDEEFIGIESMTLNRAVRPVHAPAVDLARLKTFDEYMEDVASFVSFGVERKRCDRRLVIGGIEKVEVGSRSVSRVDGEIDAFV